VNTLNHIDLTKKTNML